MIQRNQKKRPSIYRIKAIFMLMLLAVRKYGLCRLISNSDNSAMYNQKGETMNPYRLGSFNLYKFHAKTHKDLEIIRRIIVENRIDILSIQEIFSQNALDNLLMVMGPHWDGRWATPESRSASAAEGYAFVWNKDRIGLSQRRSGSFFEPVIHNQYSHKDGGGLVRNPFYGRFVIKDNTMIELRIINTHIMFSLERAENESEDHDSSITHPGAVSMRKREFSILASKILPKLDDKAYDQQWNECDDICRKPYTILMGDYNLNLRESGAKDSFIDEPLIIIREPNSEKRIVTVQSDLTTLKAKPSDGSAINGYRNNFDHFTYDANRPIQTKAWAVDIPNDASFFQGDYERYKKDVSDHLMIMIEISFV